jgi:hypothetical protein
MDVSRVKDWGEVRALLLESYRLIAPKRTLATLEGPPNRSTRETKRSDMPEERGQVGQVPFFLASVVNA